MNDMPGNPRKRILGYLDVAQTTRQIERANEFFYRLNDPLSRCFRSCTVLNKTEPDGGSRQ